MLALVSRSFIQNGWIIPEPFQQTQMGWRRLQNSTVLSLHVPFQLQKFFLFFSMPIFMVHYPSKMILNGIAALNAEQENRLYLIRQNVAFLALFLLVFLYPAPGREILGRILESSKVSLRSSLCWLWNLPHYVPRCSLFPTVGTFHYNSSKQTRGTMCGIL